MKWAGRLAMGVVALCIAAVVVFLGASEWVIRRPHRIPMDAIVADRTPNGVREGERLAHILSCLDCHGPQAQGRVLLDKPMFASLAAPALAPIVQRESDAALARTIRHGVSARGATLWAMPARNQLAADDTARLLGYLRTLRPSDRDVPERTWFGPIGRQKLLLGQLEPSVKETLAAPLRRPADEGGYLVNMVCLACHDLYKARPIGPAGVAPPLAFMAAAYDDAAFTRLMRTGVGMSPRDLGEMRVAAQTGFSHFTDGEIRSIKTYLSRAAAEAPAQ